MLTIAAAPFNTIFAARDVHMADDAGEAGIGHVHAAVAVDDFGRGAHLHMAERFDALQFAGGAQRIGRLARSSRRLRRRRLAPGAGGALLSTV